MESHTVFGDPDAATDGSTRRLKYHGGHGHVEDADADGRCGR